MPPAVESYGLRGVKSQKIVKNEGFIDAIGMRGVGSSFLIWLRMQSEESEFDLNQTIKFPYLKKKAAMPELSKAASKTC